jgi:hypothetical protein
MGREGRGENAGGREAGSVRRVLFDSPRSRSR